MLLYPSSFPVSMQTRAWDTPVPNHLSKLPELTRRDLWIKTTVGINCKQPVFCYCTQQWKPCCCTHEAIWFAESRSGISALASTVAASHLLWAGGKGMKQEHLNWKILLSAHVFCLVDCCPGSHLPLGWGCLQPCSTKVKSGCWRDRGTRSGKNDEVYLQGYLGDCAKRKEMLQLAWIKETGLFQKGNKRGAKFSKLEKQSN